MSALSRISCVLAAIALLSFIAPALGDDLSPPPWPRLGAANLSTSQEWEFLTPANTMVAPDGNTVPLNAGNGGPGPAATMSPNLTWGIGDGDGQWTNNSAAQGAISLPIPNWIDNQPMKLMHLQATYGGATPFFTVESLTKTGYAGSFGVFEWSSSESPANNGQLQHVEDWQIMPNPDWENLWLRMPPNCSVDQLIIDTISEQVPEPAALGLAILAAGLLVRREKKLEGRTGELSARRSSSAPPPP